jgi:hypothetical protein
MMMRRRLLWSTACRLACSSVIPELPKLPPKTPKHIVQTLRLLSSSKDAKDSYNDKHRDDCSDSPRPEQTQTLNLNFTDKDPFYERRAKRSLKEYETVDQFTELVEIRMPEVEGFSHGQVVKWHKQQGDVIRYEDVLCEIQFDLLDAYTAKPGEEQNDVSALQPVAPTLLRA